MARGEDTGNHPNRKVDKENSIIRMNKTFSMPEGQAGIDAMRQIVDAKFTSHQGPSLADLRSIIGKQDS